MDVKVKYIEKIAWEPPGPRADGVWIGQSLEKKIFSPGSPRPVL